MISKELLSEVLEEDISGYELYCGSSYENNIKQSIIIYRYEFDPIQINLYEFANKCKKWAYDNGYSYLGTSSLINIHNKDGSVIPLIDTSKNYKYYDIEIDFIACQWILNNKD